MSRLQLIESALAAIDQSGFQILCDAYLAQRNPNYRAFSRTGSKSGKRKTVIGTPDSFLLLPGGKYLFVECSTNISAGVAKVEDDIKKCLNEKKTGIQNDQISEIIVCLNFNLKPSDVERLNKTVADTRIRLTIETLDSISLEVYLHHRNLSSEFLGLPIDSGQVISVRQFVDEYNAKASAISTQLDNQFIDRAADQAKLLASLNKNDFVIVTGAAGVGKTRLSIETVQAFLRNEPSFKAYCISYKNHSLLEDLHQYIDSNGDYLLFVDDANRIDAINQIIGFYKSSKQGKLKVLLTTRDYAFVEFSRLVTELAYETVEIGKLTDEMITKIIEAQPFEVRNSMYVDPIKAIANGNPRIAIMAAKLAKLKQNPRVLSDVSKLFDKYYSTYILDKGTFSSELNIQCLGLVAFFYTIPYKDRSLTESILRKFGLDYSQFIEAINELDNLELVEIQFEHVKIPEQNLSTFFFFKAFVQDRALSFRTLLNNYFHSNQSRFEDCVIPANNMFGAKRVMDKLRPALKDYWAEIDQKWPEAVKFISSFWFYMQDESLELVLNRVNSFKQVDNPVFEVKYGMNDFTYHNDEIVHVLVRFFRFPSPAIVDAIELAFAYVKKKPLALPLLIHSIRENMLFDIEDEGSGYYRQFSLFRFLIAGVQRNDSLFVASFFELGKSFLRFVYRHTKAGRNNTIVISHYSLSDEPLICEFRDMIWSCILDNYDLSPELAVNTLSDYSKNSFDVNTELVQKDTKQILRIIDKHLSPENFNHCQFVNQFNRWATRMGVRHEDLDELPKTFRNKVYELYVVLDWDRLRDKDSFEFDNHKEYEQLKEQQIREQVNLTSQDDLESFYTNFEFLKTKSSNWYGYNRSFLVVLENVIRTNHDLGYDFLQLIVDKKNSIEILPNTVIDFLLKDTTQTEKLWNVLDGGNYAGQADWKLSYFYLLNKGSIRKDHAVNLIETIHELDKPLFIHLDRLRKYQVVSPKLLDDIIAIIYRKNEQDQTGLTVWGDVFSDEVLHADTDLKLIQRFYLQQRKIQQHFDLNLKGLKKIVAVDRFFLVDYVSSLYNKERHSFDEDHSGLGFVWDLKEAEEIVERVFEIVRKQAWWSGIREHYANTFFKNISEDRIPRAKSFLIEFVKRNQKTPRIINEAVDITLNAFKSAFESLLLTYIRCNPNAEDFMRIHWTDNGGVYSGDVIISDLRAAEWRNILAIVDGETSQGVKLRPIKKALAEKIETELRFAEEERKSRFLNRF